MTSRSSDEASSKKTPIAAVTEKTGRNVLDVGFNEITDEQKNRERIRKMAEIHTLPPAELDNKKIVYPGMDDAEVLNKFRELRTKLYQTAAASGKENFILMVTSLLPKSGTTYTSINLGATIALDQSKTAVVVDCNFYKPSVHKLLEIQPDFGLSNYLDDISLDAEDIIYASGIRRLRIVPAGQARDVGTEYFTSSRMKRFLGEVKSRYKDRNVILDTPPLNTSADARILSELCDLIVIVAPHGKLTASQLESGVASIDQNKLAGVILNG